MIEVKKHLTGDIALPKGAPRAHRKAFNDLLRRLAAAARDCGQVWNVNDGYRSYAEQVVFWKRWLKYRKVLAAKPGTSNHGFGKAADVSAPGGSPVGASARRRAALDRYGLCLPVPGEAWHVEVGEVWRGGAKP